jgi:heme-degrading monooxygenase HmoA
VYARSTTIRARPDAIDEGISYVRDEVMPMIQQIDGCIGISMLADRESGRCIATSAWQSMEAMRASDEQLRSIRDRAGEIMGGSPEIEEWEIAYLHRDHQVPEGAGARSSWLESGPEEVDRAIDVFKMGIMPQLEQLDGFCSASLLVNRETGRSVATTSWDSREAMEGSRDKADTMRSGFTKEVPSRIVDVCEFEVALAHLHAPEMA